MRVSPTSATRIFLLQSSQCRPIRAIPHTTVYVTGFVLTKDAVSNIPPGIGCFSISVTFLRGTGYPLDATFVVSKSVFADRITPFLSLAHHDHLNGAADNMKTVNSTVLR